ncbi:MAG: GNAT family N-acetyltransferase [Bacilli bacterium]
MKIERLSAETIKPTSELLDAYRQFYRQESNLEAAILFLKTRFENEESVVYVALIENEVVGFVQLYPTFSTVGLQRAYILNDLYVASSARRKGIGQALIQQCYAWCEENNARYVTLETARGNSGAQKLYEQMGMNIDREVLHYSKYW